MSNFEIQNAAVASEFIRRAEQMSDKPRAMPKGSPAAQARWQKILGRLGLLRTPAAEPDAERR